MNLLMISGDRSLSQGKRGAFWYTLDVLREHFDRIDIICPRVSSASSATEPFSNVFLHPSPWPLLFQSRWIVRKGKELIREHHHQTMTVHEFPPFYNGWGAWRLSRKTKIPYALEIHHIVGFPEAASFAEGIGYALSLLFLPFDARRATTVRTVNATVRDVLSRWGIPRHKIQIVPSLYIDTTIWKPDPFADKKFDLVCCGRMVENKGLIELLEALAEIPTASLLLIGDGPLRKELERHVQQLGLSSRVTFAGWMPSQEDVARAVRSARVFVMNSRSEGGPRVVAEAMAAGMPVIATNVGVVPDIINNRENGMVVPMERLELVGAIRALLADPSLQQKIGIEAAKIGERFERRKRIGVYAEFLQSLSSSRA